MTQLNLSHSKIFKLFFNYSKILFNFVNSIGKFKLHLLYYNLLQTIIKVKIRKITHYGY